MPETPRQSPPHRIVAERVVRADPRRVWDVLTDVAHADQTLRGVTRVEVLTDGPYGVGTRWRETRRMLGTNATEEMQVTAADAPTRTVVEADSRGTHYVTEFSVVPTDRDVTRLRMTFTAEQPDATGVQRVLGRVFARLGARATRTMMAKDLQDIAARAERA